MKRVTLTLALLLVVTSALAGSARADATVASSATARLHTLEQDVLTRLNTIRASRGLRPLVLSDSLAGAAVSHSRSMLSGGFFEHESRDGAPFSDRVKRYYPAAGFEQWSVGENLLYATGGDATATTVIDAWLDSPAHRRNMLSPGWREVGIGALEAGAAGGVFSGERTLVVTMDFGMRLGEGAQIVKLIPPKSKTAKPKVRRLLPLPAALS